MLTYTGVLQGRPEGQDAVYVSFGDHQYMLFCCRPDVAESYILIVLHCNIGHRSCMQKQGRGDCTALAWRVMALQVLSRKLPLIFTYLV